MHRILSFIFLSALFLSGCSVATVNDLGQLGLDQRERPLALHISGVGVDKDSKALSKDAVELLVAALPQDFNVATDKGAADLTILSEVRYFGKNKAERDKFKRSGVDGVHAAAIGVQAAGAALFKSNFVTGSALILAGGTADLATKAVRVGTSDNYYAYTRHVLTVGKEVYHFRTYQDAPDVDGKAAAYAQIKEQIAAEALGMLAQAVNPELRGHGEQQALLTE